MDFRYVKILLSALFLLHLRKTNCGLHGQEGNHEPHCYSRFDYEYKVVQKLVLLETNNSKLQTENDRLQQEVEILKTEVKELSASCKSAHPNSFVAFLAVMNEQRRTFQDKDTIIFDTVITNIGNAYSSTDGYFTATYDGVYQFSASILTDNNGEVWSYFSLNGGDAVANIYGRASDTRHDQGAQTVILQLKKGDNVCVINRYKTNIYGDRYTSFSGVLLN